MPILACAALMTSLIGWASYVPVVKFPKLRRTLWPTRALEYFALLLACAALAIPVDDPQTNVLLVSLTCVSFAIFTLLYYVSLRLPVSTGRPEAGKLLPTFEVTGENGKPFTSDQFLGKGPLLFIFFRGFW